MTHSAGATAESVRRPDGADICWEWLGEGPLVILAHHTLWSHPALYLALVGDLARDHRVVLYDPRGCGHSSRRGPYGPQTDAADLEAVVEAASGDAVAVAIGNGFNRTVRIAAAQPDLIPHVIAMGPAPAAFLPRAEIRDSGLLAASESVVEMVLQMMTADPRAALRTMIAAANPDVDEEELRKRVAAVIDYVDVEAETERTRAWLDDDLREQVRMLGDRLSILHGGADPLFEGALGERVTELFPRARIQQVADGAVSRPDLTAAWVRQVRGAPTARK